MKKIVSYTLCGLFSSLLANGQTSQDALRYSESAYLGTARVASMGGSFGALGADASAIGINPAGLAIYRRSELSFTPSVVLRNNETSFFGNSMSDSKYNFNIGQMGLVLAAKPTNADQHGWRALNFSITYNRLANYNSKSSYSGFNPSNSMLDYFIQNANTGKGTQAQNLDPFFENLAYQTYLINPIDSVDTTHYYSEIPFGGVLQRKNTGTSGSMNEFLASLAGNYKDRLYLGASLGYQVLSFTENTSYQEVDQEDSIANFRSFVFDQRVNTEGAGAYLRIGMLYKPADWVKLGGSIQTPTLFKMEDTYRSTMKSDLDTTGTHDFTADGAYKYEFSSPLKATASIGFLMGKQACVNIDYETLNYSEARFSSAGDAFFDTNNAIDATYRSTSTIRLGAEYRWDNLSFRGGYFMSGSPFKQGIAQPGFDFSSKGFAAGIGIRDDHYFLDLGYTCRYTDTYYRSYSLMQEAVEGAKTHVTNQQFIVTLGYKFL